MEEDILDVMGDKPRILATKIHSGHDNTNVFCHITTKNFLDFIEVPAFREGTKDPKASNIQDKFYLLDRPYNINNLIALQKVNTHHMVCLNAKVSATVGLGFSNETKKKNSKPKLNPNSKSDVMKVLNNSDPDAREIEDMVLPSLEDELLDPLTNDSFQHVMTQMSLDFEHGDGYIEVVRDRYNNIVGLHFMPAGMVTHVLDPNTFKLYYLVSPLITEDTFISGIAQRRLMPKFGTKKEFLDDIANNRISNTLAGADLNLPDNKSEYVSELIHFSLPSNLSRYYGHTDFLAVVPYLELFRSMVQHKVDFFNNRGVPEFLATIIPEGAPLTKSQFDTISAALSVNKDSITKRRSAAIQLPKGAKLQIDKLGAEQIADTFKDDSETIASGVVSAHGVPPLLANILLPGKLAASNELPNALMAFQVLLISKRQRIMSRILNNTLGKDMPSLKGKFKFRRITDLFDLEQMDTMSRMKEPVVGSNRDLSQGLKD